MDDAKNGKCKFVLTYAYCDWDINGCIGIYDDPDKVMGVIIDKVFELWDESDPKLTGSYDGPEFKFKFCHDSSEDLYYDVEIRYPWSMEEPDIYRVYYLREESAS